MRGHAFYLLTVYLAGKYGKTCLHPNLEPIIPKTQSTLLHANLSIKMYVRDKKLQVMSQRTHDRAPVNVEDLPNLR